MEKAISKKKNQLVYGGTVVILLIIAIILIVVIINKNKVNTDVDTEILEQPQVETSENVKVTTEGIKENISNKLKEEKKLEGMTIKEIKFQSKDNVTKFTATIDNTTLNDFKGTPVEIIFKNKNGEEISRLAGYVNDTLKGAKSYIDASTTIDITEAYDFTIQLKK